MIKMRKLQLKQYNLPNYFLFDEPSDDYHESDECDLFFSKPRVEDYPAGGNPSCVAIYAVKVLKALQRINEDQYDFILRFNVSTFINFRKLVFEDLQRLPKTKLVAGPPLDVFKKYILGTCMIWSSDVIKFLKSKSILDPAFYQTNDDSDLSLVSKSFTGTYNFLDQSHYSAFEITPGYENFSTVRIKNTKRDKDVLVWQDLLSKVDKIKYFLNALPNCSCTNHPTANQLIQDLVANPNDCEIVFKLVQHYRYSLDYLSAKTFYKLALALNPSPELKQKLDCEFSIIGFYVNEPNMDRFNTALINQIKCIPSFLLDNYKFYGKVIKDFAKTLVDHSFTFEQENYRFTSSTPCIFLSSSGELLLNIRAVNYTISPSGNYEVKNSKILNKNLLIKLDYISLKKAKDSFEVWQEFAFQHDDVFELGCQDLKIESKTNRCIFTHDIGNNQRHVFMTSSDNIYYQQVKSPFGRTCEKNWALFGRSRIVYEWFPLSIAILEKDFSLRFLKRDENTPSPFFFQHIRGSTNGFLYNNEAWFICHLTKMGKPRTYYHVFVVLDELTYEPLRWSPLFTFEGEPIEFCLGLVIDDKNQRLIVSYSVWDRTSKVIALEKSFVESFTCITPT